MTTSSDVLRFDGHACTAAIEAGGYAVKVEPGDLRGETIPEFPKRWRATATRDKDDRQFEVEGAPNKIAALRSLTVLCMLSGHTMII